MVSGHPNIILQSTALQQHSDAMLAIARQYSAKCDTVEAKHSAALEEVLVGPLRGEIGVERERVAKRNGFTKSGQ